jgi:hypothetical protein
MIIAQSNSAGTVIGSPQVHFTWYCGPADFEKKFFLFVLKDKTEIAERISQAT